jgi:hypothetical protein
MSKRKRQRKVSRTVKEPSAQDIENAIERLLKYLLAGIGRYIGFLNFSGSDRCTIIVCNERTGKQTKQKTRRIPLAGEPGCGYVFIDTQKVPDNEQKKWLRTLVHQHLAARPEMLHIFMPVQFLEVLLADDLLEALLADDLLEDCRQSALQDWEEFQNKRNLCETYQRELREFNSVTGFVTGKARSGEYVDDYTRAVKTFAIAAFVETDLSPLKICSLIRKGQMLSAETPDGYTGDGIEDGKRACRYLDIATPKVLLDVQIFRKDVSKT